MESSFAASKMLNWLGIILFLTILAPPSNSVDLKREYKAIRRKDIFSLEKEIEEGIELGTDLEKQLENSFKDFKKFWELLSSVPDSIRNSSHRTWKTEDGATVEDDEFIEKQKNNAGTFLRFGEKKITRAKFPNKLALKVGGGEAGGDWPEIDGMKYPKTFGGHGMRISRAKSPKKLEPPIS